MSTGVREPLELQTGDRMSREEFHRIYEQMPEGFKAELIGGIVYVASPLRRSHGTSHLTFGTLLRVYAGRTPGVEAGDNTTLLLGDDSEPQPDLYLRILPEYGGQSSTDKKDYVVGAPELVAEVAHSSRAIDLPEARAGRTALSTRSLQLGQRGMKRSGSALARAKQDRLPRSRHCASRTERF